MLTTFAVSNYRTLQTAQQLFPVRMTRQQIKDSQLTDSDSPVSLHHARTQFDPDQEFRMAASAIFRDYE